MASLALVGFCGMRIPILDDVDRDEVRDRAARVIREKRGEGYGVTILERGHEWEFVEPEDAFMVPDDAGYLMLTEAEEHVCDDCRSYGPQACCGCETPA